MGLPNKIQQVSESQAGGVRRDFRQIVFDAPVGAMELEDNLIAARNVRSKEAVTSLSSSGMGVESQALAERIGYIEPLSQSSGRYGFSLLPHWIQKMGNNRITFAQKIKRIPAADDQDDEKVDNKESQVERMAFPPHLRSHHSPATKALRYRARFLRPGREQKVRLPEPYLALWLLLYFRRIGVSRFTNSLAFDAS